MDNRTLWWSPDAPALIDVHEFDRLAASAQSRGSAVDLYRGDLLERVDEEWLFVIRERYRTRLSELLLGLSDSCRRYGDPTNGIRYARRLLSMDPFAELGLRHLMEAQAEAGDVAGALKDFLEFRERLNREMGAEPAPETVTLFERLRVRHASEPANKDGQIRHNVPLAATTFIGREREMAELSDLVGRYSAVTVVGVGGMGKSRLVQQIATRVVANFADGVRFVTLAELPETDSILGALTTSLGLSQGSETGMQQLVLEHLAERDVLVVLDNCERHVPACRGLVQAVLDTCPRVRVLSTSRIPIGHAGERLYHLEPLAIPHDLESGSRPIVAASDASQLFLERAATVAPAQPLTAEDASALVDICRRLGGIPLALEIAAARRRVLTIAQISERLGDAALVLDYARDDASAHQRTVRSAIAWSYEGLADHERRTFRSLSAFRSPFTLAAAERAAESASAAPPIVDQITSLAERSLLYVIHGEREARYRLLEPVREFAYMRLLEANEACAAVERVIAHYADTTRKLGLPEGGDKPRLAYDAIEPDRPNIRFALESVVDFGASLALATELALSMTLLWQDRGLVAEGTAVLARLGAVLASEPPTPVIVRLLNEASDLARLAADYDLARHFCSLAADAAGKIDDRAGAAAATFAAATIDYTINDLASAEEKFARARADFEACGESGQAARAMIDLGLIDLQKARFEPAATQLREALAALRPTGQHRWIAFATSGLAFAERFLGNLPEARALSLESLALARDSANLLLMNTSLSNLAHIAVLSGDGASARTCLREGLLLVRVGAYTFSLLHYLETASRLLYNEGDYRASAVLFSAVYALAATYSMAPTSEDAEILASLGRSLSIRLSESELSRAREELGAASTQSCVDAALRCLSL